MSQQLSNIRVLDLSRILAAPWAAQMLGDMGADVIKVERPRVGDDSRHFGPPFLKDADGNNTLDSAFFISANRSKRSITINLSKPEGQKLVLELLAQSDVLIENYKVGDLKRYGLDYESLRQVNPKLIYCSVTGFGQTGPYALRPGYDTVFQGMGGLMASTGLPDGLPGGGPMKTGPSLADILSGHYTVSAILSALYHRDARGGEGQHIDVSLLDSVIASMSHYASHYLVSGQNPIRRGTEGNGGMPSRMYRCADQDIVVIAGNEEQFSHLCEVLGCTELIGKPEFSSSALRGINRDAMAVVMEPLFLKRQSAELLQSLENAGVPAGPINSLSQTFADPHVQSRGMQVDVSHPNAPQGRLNLVAYPVKFSATPVASYHPPPSLGQHTREILASHLGLSSQAMDALAAQGVI
jgi:crotonobetainyl-CoA:carnitine CoA-transferase CaiB-like acyl-CoA transferase